MLPPLDRHAPEGVFVNGRWVATAENRTFETTSPATGEVIATVPAATAPDVDAAVRAAHEAYEREWADTTAEERHGLLMAYADRIAAHADRLAAIEVVDNGSTYKPLRVDVDRAVDSIQMYASYARQLRGGTFPLGPDQLAMTVREPYGVVAQIIPFNHPLMFVARAIGITLATGNTVVLKPSEYTSLTALELAELTRDLLPDGVVNVLTGFGADCGAPMVEHELVKKVHFRGSLATGNQLRVACARRRVPLTLELGGKNAFVVYPDADVEAAAKGATRGLNLQWQGQSCGSATRLFVHDDVYDEFRDRLVENFGQARIGLPWDEESTIGAIVSRPQYDRILEYLESGHEQGARALIGGSAYQHPQAPDGMYVEPTIFEVEDPSLRVATEEIFGPVTSLMRWSDEDEVMRLANSLDYGLTGSVWSRDLQTAHRAARRLETGTVWINQHGPRPPGVPTGGWKSSGVGQEAAIEEIENYTRTKTVLVNLG